MPQRPATLPASGHAAWDDLAAWWLSRYQPSTQRTYATYLPRWVRWCTGRGIDPLAARRADVELWLRSVADSGLARASIAAHHDAVASLYRLAHEEELVAVGHRDQLCVGTRQWPRPESRQLGTSTPLPASLQPAPLRLWQGGGRVCRRPIPKGRGARFRRPRQAEDCHRVGGGTYTIGTAS